MLRSVSCETFHKSSHQTWKDLSIQPAVGRGFPGNEVVGIRLDGACARKSSVLFAGLGG